MLAAGALFLLGAGLTVAGIAWSALYDIGILVLIVAAVGIVVRIGDWARGLLGGRTAAAVKTTWPPTSAAAPLSAA